MGASSEGATSDEVPRAQIGALVASLPVLEKARRMKPETLQGSVVLANPDNGEIYAARCVGAAGPFLTRSANTG